MAEIKALGATLVAICPQLEQYSRETIEQHKLSFDLLSDKGNEVAAAYGLRFALPQDLVGVYGKFGIDLKQYNGDDSWTLPIPARFVIDQSGIIRSAEADADYSTRPEPADTVAALKAIKGG